MQWGMPDIKEDKVAILSECGQGEDVFISRIPLLLLGAKILFSFTKVQFPLRISFAMSINKSLSQTLSILELHLEKKWFSYEQLNIGYFRVGSKMNICFFFPQGKTKNIVYQEVLYELQNPMMRFSTHCSL